MIWHDEMHKALRDWLFKTESKASLLVRYELQYTYIALWFYAGKWPDWWDMKNEIVAGDAVLGGFCIHSFCNVRVYPSLDRFFILLLFCIYAPFQ